MWVRTVDPLASRTVVLALSFLVLPNFCGREQLSVVPWVDNSITKPDRIVRLASERVQRSFNLLSDAIATVVGTVKGVSWRHKGMFVPMAGAFPLWLAPLRVIRWRCSWRLIVIHDCWKFWCCSCWCESEFGVRKSSCIVVSFLIFSFHERRM